jgi:hypothetical protein
VADKVVEWAVESIPDDNCVFMRAHRQHFSQGDLGHGVFRRREKGVSVDWDRYSTSEDTRARANSDPNDNAVISLLVSCIRQIRPLAVDHDPISAPPEKRNRAHSLIRNLPRAADLTEARFKLRKCAHIVIPLG